MCGRRRRPMQPSKERSLPAGQPGEPERARQPARSAVRMPAVALSPGPAGHRLMRQCHTVPCSPSGTSPILRMPSLSSTRTEASRTASVCASSVRGDASTNNVVPHGLAGSSASRRIGSASGKPPPAGRDLRVQLSRQGTAVSDRSLQQRQRCLDELDHPCPPTGALRAQPALDLFLSSVDEHG